MPSDDFWNDTPRRVRPASKSSELTVEEVSAQESVGGDTVSSSASLPWLKLVIVALMMVLSAGIGVGLFLYQSLISPVDPTKTQSTVFEVVRGQKTEDIITHLETEGLIISRYPVLAYITIRSLKLHAGFYTFSSSQSARSMIDQMSTAMISEYQVTIPEGWRAAQIGQMLEKTGIVPQADFVAAAHYDPTRYTLPQGLTLQPGDSLEGFLFPDTYRLARGVTSKEIVQKMLNNFSSRTKDLRPTRDQVILASIIEREAKLDVDRPKMASVYTNRLKQNMRLQADPTVTYAKDTALFSEATEPAAFVWWAPITVANYTDVVSPYNTYLNKGLPPGPIANPGLKSIAAAFHPETTSFYFFLNLADGTTIYSKTQAEHVAAKQKYLTNE